MFEELDVPFNTMEIIKACKSLNLGKSAGPDFLINEFFKYGIESNQLISALCNLFNTIFDLRYFPEEWTEGFIVPLH